MTEYSSERLFLNIIATNTVLPFKIHGISLGETFGIPKRLPWWRRTLYRVIGRQEPVRVLPKRVVMGPRAYYRRVDL